MAGWRVHGVGGGVGGVFVRGGGVGLGEFGGGWWYFGFLDLYNPYMISHTMGMMGGWAWVGG